MNKIKNSHSLSTLFFSPASLMKKASNKGIRFIEKLRQVAPPVCNDIQLWCKRHQCAGYTLLREASSIARKPPRTLDVDVHQCFLELLSFENPARVLVTIPKARVAGSSGLVVLPDGSFVGELIAVTPAGRRGMLQAEKAYCTRLQKPVKKTGRYFLLMIIGWPNFYHWNHDMVMRMSACVDALPKDIRFVVPEKLTAFRNETLKVLGIPEERLARFSGDEVWELESLSFCSPIQKTQLDTPEPPRWYRNRALLHYGITPGAAQRRIHISRAGASRKVINEAEIEECLKPYGFETLRLEKLTFPEQVRMFSEADAVVGPHGAGLTNILFSLPNSRVLELFEPAYVRNCFWTMCEALGHEYWYLIGEGIAGKRTDHGNDILVPIEAFSETLRRMFASASSLGETVSQEPFTTG